MNGICNKWTVNISFHLICTYRIFRLFWWMFWYLQEDWSYTKVALTWNCIVECISNHIVKEFFCHDYCLTNVTRFRCKMRCRGPISSPGSSIWDLCHLHERSLFLRLFRMVKEFGATLTLGAFTRCILNKNVTWWYAVKISALENIDGWSDRLTRDNLVSLKF